MTPIVHVGSTMLALMLLASCMSTSRDRNENENQTLMGLGSPHGSIGQAPGMEVSDKHVFKLMRFNKTKGSWEPVSKVPAKTKAVNLIFHGLRQSDRKGAFEVTSEMVFHEHGLLNFSKGKTLVPPPAEYIQGEIYAMMWDSRHPNPIGLENLLMRVHKNNGKPSALDLDQFISAMEEDLILDQTDTEFFMHMYRFYQESFQDYQGLPPHFAGFSKGAHVAIKLAEYTTAAKISNSLKPRTVALLDPYVGPAFANGNIGQDLLKKVKILKARGVGFLNVQTSQIQGFRILSIPASDEHFYSGLRDLVGEIKITRNKAEENLLAPVKVTGNPILDKLYLDHSRALPFWYGSVLVCNLPIPSLNDGNKTYPDRLSLTLETPSEITAWIYDGVIQPRCSKGQKKIEVY
jgi:hypothetical protein